MEKTAIAVVSMILFFGFLVTSFDSCTAQRPPFQYFQILVPSYSITEGATFGIIIVPISPQIYTSDVTINVSTGTIRVLSTEILGEGRLLSVSIDNGGVGGVNIIVSDDQGHSDYASVFFTPRNSPSSSPTTSPTPYLPSDRNAPRIDPKFYLISISVIFVAIAVSILIYRTHRKSTNLVKKP